MRCNWADGPRLTRYHDLKWGMPVHDAAATLRSQAELDSLDPYIWGLIGGCLVVNC
jgi:3-methyladenine DNA glycosylase Tag